MPPSAELLISSKKMPQRVGEMRWPGLDRSMVMLAWPNAECARPVASTMAAKATRVRALSGRARPRVPPGRGVAPAGVIVEPKSGVMRFESVMLFSGLLCNALFGGKSCHFVNINRGSCAVHKVTGFGDCLGRLSGGFRVASG